MICRICGSENLTSVLRLPSTPPGDHFVSSPDVVQSCYPLQIMLCKSCGLAQLDTVVPPADIYSRYLYTTKSSPGLDAYFAGSAAAIRAAVPLMSDQLVLDIGSNDGTLLRCLQPYARVVGVDPAEHIASAADAAGIPTVAAWWTRETAETIRRTHGPASLITATNVMANVDDIHPWLEAVTDAIADDGTFVIETGYWPDLVEKLLLETVEHEHLSYFSVRSLRCLAVRHDLRLVRVEHTESKGGSIRAYFQRRSVPHTIWGADDNFLERREVALNVADFQRRAEAICTQVHDIARTSVLQGRTVMAYGASIGGTTLLYACDLNSVVECMLDDNPERYGLFTPGAHLPVMSSAAMAQADDVVVLAWRYFDRIRAAHPEFKGRYIVPLPQVIVHDARTGEVTVQHAA